MITQCSILLAHLDKNPSKHVLPFSTADCDPRPNGGTVCAVHTQPPHLLMFVASQTFTIKFFYIQAQPSQSNGGTLGH